MRAVPRPDTASSVPTLYTTEQVARLFDIKPDRLRYWAHSGFIVPSGRSGGRPAYTFRDLVAVKVACALLAQGMGVRRVRGCLDALRVKLPAADRDLASARIRVVEGHLVVDDGKGPFDPRTGQGVLDFRVDGLRAQTAEVVELRAADAAEDDESAYAAFERGLRLEQTDPEAARAAYRRAVEIDPYFAAAWTNLGSLEAELGDLDAARDCFERAIEADPDQPEARMNLAELALRSGDADVAIFGYRQVLATSPEHYEAHYGLARALLSVGGRAQAAAHLERFVRAAERAGVANEQVAAARRVLQRLREGPKLRPRP
ncbi:MAG: tetratricopeptide repeat protein [Deltaproteobacteria bacterium]|nr:MAG: tetratricopeptide repeat protein [Deltaproteobacteria bacterium]